LGLVKKLKVIDKISEQTIDLKERWANFRRENPQVRIRDAAKELGVSEAELLATQIGDSVVRLNDNFDDILQELHALGRIMALTRNEEIVHERKGEYKNVEVLNGHGKMGLVLGDDIDLRIFFKNWHFGFAVTNENPSGTTRSFQFFDRSGTAVHKVFLTDASDLTAYETLAEKYRGGDQNRILKVASKSAKKLKSPILKLMSKVFVRRGQRLKIRTTFLHCCKNLASRVGRRCGSPTDKWLIRCC
jgi:putative hemin transport protein